MSQKPKVFRFTFSDNMISLLHDFAITHKYEDKNDFKENWEIWKHSNEESIQRELSRLINMGFTGDINDKMYKSVRYYYSKKPNVQDNENKGENKKQRRKYIGISREILNLMDEIIKDSIQGNLETKSYQMKPCEIYNKFLEKYQDNAVQNEIERLIEEMENEEEVKLKIKKTFKNRYFNHFHGKNN